MIVENVRCVLELILMYVCLLVSVCVVGDVSSLLAFWSVYHWCCRRLWDVQWSKHRRFGWPDWTGS